VRWLAFVSHEYFHAFNVKRLRPIDLGPFDYENPPQEPSLWVSEGLTVYYGELMVNRAGLATSPDFMTSQSNHIRTVQNGAGRLKQTLEQSSLNVWKQSTSGIGGDANNTVSYYDKGDLVGLLLDAKIRHLTAGKKSLDDLMRLAMQRYGGKVGFKPEELETTASEVAGADLRPWFEKVLRSTQELDYSEFLEWYGLRFITTDDPKKAWTLEPLPDASEAQKAHWRVLVETALPK
jgi:predicted metalloprotease with PDZ domain